ncbi:MAG: hypothetical protein WC956_08940, partial [bacterium]
NLSEEDANEILVLLSENGIKPTKKKEVRQNETTYSIEVKEADMVKARSLLLSHNLPRRKELGLTGVYKEKGLIPTPDEQKARYILALKGEIINSLRRIPQVVDADVVLNVPTKEEFQGAEAQHEQRPTASVVVRVKPEAAGTSFMTEAKIQQFVSNAVEGMNPRDVTVVISYLPLEEKSLRPGDVQTLPSQMPQMGQQPEMGPPPAVQYELIGLKLDAESKDRLKIYMLIFFVLLIVLSSTLIIVIVQGSRMRRTLAALKGSAGHHEALEGHIMDDGPPQLGQGPPQDEF